MSERDKNEKFLKNYQDIHAKFLDFLDNEENTESNFQNLNKLLKDMKIRDCQHDIRLFLHMLVKVSNHYFRGPDFFTKIFRVLSLFKDDIKKYQNARIFNIFRSNRLILLFLIEEKILTVDEYFVKQIINDKYAKKKYPQYFAPEIKPFMNENWFPYYNEMEEEKGDDDEENEYEWVKEVTKELPDDFFELRKIGENGSYISKLIREDLIEDFIFYVNKNCISRNATIKQSIYETNSYLIKNQVQLIEYAAFFGSIQIFAFLKIENAALESSLCINAIHSKNAEMILLLEEIYVKIQEKGLKNNEKVDEQSYRDCLIESIKCNHNQIADYFHDNYPQVRDKYLSDTIKQSLKYYNFAFLQNQHINESSFCLLCYCDYYSLVRNLLISGNIDISKTLINNHYLLIQFKIISFNEIQNHYLSMKF